MATVKEERLQIRVDTADKLPLERAAAASHLNVSAFVVQAAAAKAEEILAERSSIPRELDASAEMRVSRGMREPGVWTPPLQNSSEAATLWGSGVASASGRPTACRLSRSHN